MINSFIIQGVNIISAICCYDCSIFADDDENRNGCDGVHLLQIHDTRVTKWNWKPGYLWYHIIELRMIFIWIHIDDFDFLVDRICFVIEVH